ncbi:MAG: hypothetical protein HY927_14825 [Elusimicrobia bacterium]|nr:hypothetical protein [Elusimicrobiota bacterium]
MKASTLFSITMAALLLAPPAARAAAAKPAGKAAPTAAAKPAPAASALSAVQGLAADDMPYDAGSEVLISWKAMPYDAPAVKYTVHLSSISRDGPWAQGAVFPSDTKYRADIDLPFWAWKKTKDRHAVALNLETAFGVDDEVGKKRLRGSVIYAKVVASDGTSEAASPAVSALATSDWFSLPKLNNFVFTLLFCCIVLWFISNARKKDLFMRRIPGLDAVEDAIGRATEMGRPIYFLTGRLDIDSISTIASSLILGEIAKRIAQYDTQLKVPHTYAMTMAVCQEITKQAYSEAGRPDAYREDINFFITEDQFAYTAAVNGMMVREKPAACFYMGYYYAESLLLTEVGASVGAIQIAGSDAEHQLPFFFITCDYTLIGEELYAAGAYLSRDPVLVGTLRGQDTGKAFVMLAIFAGVILATCGVLFGFEHGVQTFLEVFKSY